jgi:hypothetical protein
VASRSSDCIPDNSINASELIREGVSVDRTGSMDPRQMKREKIAPATRVVFIAGLPQLIIF